MKTKSNIYIDNRPYVLYEGRRMHNMTATEAANLMGIDEGEYLRIESQNTYVKISEDDFKGDTEQPYDKTGRNLNKKNNGPAELVPDRLFEKFAAGLNIRIPKLPQSVSEKEFLLSCIDLRKFCESKTGAYPCENCQMHRLVVRTKREWNVCLVGFTRPCEWILTTQKEFPHKKLDMIVAHCICRPCPSCPFKQTTGSRNVWKCLFTTVVPRFISFYTEEISLPPDFGWAEPEGEKSKEATFVIEGFTPIKTT